MYCEVSSSIAAGATVDPFSTLILTYKLSHRFGLFIFGTKTLIFSWLDIHLIFHHCFVHKHPIFQFIWNITKLIFSVIRMSAQSSHGFNRSLTQGYFIVRSRFISPHRMHCKCFSWSSALKSMNACLILFTMFLFKILKSQKYIYSTMHPN